jgi:internalin A
MKKHMPILSAILLILLLAACAAPPAAGSPTLPAAAEPTATMTPTAPPAAATEVPAVVTFTDPVLEAMVHGAIGKPEGELTVAEAQAVTRLNLSIGWPQDVFDAATIQEINGLEAFTNLESLDLSAHAIRDITPLTGLTKLTLLSLDGNPVADVTPLAGLTNLKGLNLRGCAAQDYSPLAALVNLEFLLLEQAAITDVSPLAALTNLKHLYLDGSPVSDYFPLAPIYPNLVSRDFIIASTLEELGFSMSYENHEAKYATESLDVIINHTEWGAPPQEWDVNCVRMSMNVKDGYVLKLTYHPEINAYVFGMGRDGEQLMNYVYDTPENFLIGQDDRERWEPVVLAAVDVVEGEDVLLAPIRIFHDTIQATFNMSADRLYDLPFAPPTLSSLGFFPVEENAVWRYEQRDGNDVNIDIHRPEWGALDYDFQFFTELSEEYRIVMTYHSDERKFVVGADDNDLGGADFEYLIDTQEHIDGWCSNGDLTVEDYFLMAFNDPAIEDIYAHSIALVMDYITEQFGMTFEELLALPVGE